VNARSEDGNIPLHMAALAQQMDMVEWLGSNGADLNAKNAKDETPIAIALNYGRMDMMKSMWNAQYSKLEDLEKDTNSPVVSLLKEAFSGEESYLAVTVFKYICPLKFEDLKLANEDRISLIEHKYLNDNYDNLHNYVTVLEKAKEQQLEGGPRRKFLEPLRSAGSLAAVRVKEETASVDDKSRKKGIATAISKKKRKLVTKEPNALRK